MDYHILELLGLMLYAVIAPPIAYRSYWFETTFEKPEFVSFRGQHLRHLKADEISKIVCNSATNPELWRNNSSRMGIKGNVILRQVALIKKKPRSGFLYVRYSVEKYGKFFQVLYEWRGDPESIKDPASPECRAMQAAVNAIERELGKAELHKSRKEYTFGGSRHYHSTAFSPEVVRHVLTHAISVTDDKFTTINFKVCHDGRKNHLVDLVEAYVTVENTREFCIRFYALTALAGEKAWELVCDWKGPFAAMTDQYSGEWKIVQALFKLVQEQIEKSGAVPCFPSPAYSHVLNLGLYDSWSYKNLERILPGLSDRLCEGIWLKDKNSNEWFNTSGRSLSKKRVPGAQEFQVTVVNEDYLRFVPRHIQADFCIQFLAYPPRCGQFYLAWQHEEKDRIGGVLDKLAAEVEKKLRGKIERISAQQINHPHVMRVQFVQEDNLKVKAPERESWPTPQDYNEAVQAPEICFSDVDLKSGCAEINTLGIPKSATGAFASVYRITALGTDWALRCFNSPIKDQLVRYQKTSKFICADDLPYTVPCQFLEQGIMVTSKWYPVLKMEWVEGTPFCTFIGNHLHDRNELAGLRKKFATMMGDLKKNNVAHGDLQHGNIIIRNGEIVLVDYDNFFVPELAGFISWETGHRNYQHPHRNSSHFGPYLDHFSAWIIDSALLCISHEPDLWERFGAGEESMLFSALDFMNPDDSELIQILLKHRQPEIAERARFLLSLLSLEVPELPPLN